MKTILYINAAGEISGAERSLLAMLDALDRTRWQPVVAAPGGSLLAEVAGRDLRTFPLALPALHRPRTPAQAGQALAALRRGWHEVARAVQATAPAVLHANSTAAMLFACRVPCPTVWHVRDLAPLGWWGILLARRASRIAVISTTVRESLGGGARGKTVLLPPAVDTERFRPADDRMAARTHFGLPPETPLIGLVAQFVPWKRHHLFLDALCLLTAHPWFAVLAGADLAPDAGYRASLRDRLSAPPLAGRVAWLPWQPDPVPLVSALDIGVLTSHREPFGRVLIEAMACEVPVLAVDEGGPRDIVTLDTGILCPGDAPALAQALAHLLDNPELRHALGRAGRRRVLDHFALPAHRASLDALYASCR